MSEPAKSKIVPVPKAHGQAAQDIFVRLEKLEDSLLTDLRDIRAIKTELQKRTDQSPLLEKLLDAKEVAELLGQSERWVYREAKAKRLPAVRLGKYWKFSPSALQKWVERQQTP